MTTCPSAARPAGSQEAGQDGDDAALGVGGRGRPGLGQHLGWPLVIAYDIPAPSGSGSLRWSPNSAVWSRAIPSRRRMARTAAPLFARPRA